MPHSRRFADGRWPMQEGPMKRRNNVYVGATLVTLVVLLTAAQLMLQTRTAAQGIQAGVYQIDPMWPKQLPNHWVFGSVVGLAVDSRDHVWVVHRGKASIDPNLGAMMSYPRRRPRDAAAQHQPVRRALSLSSAAPKLRRSSSLTPKEMWSDIGVLPAPDSSGRLPCTASPWTGKTTCGSPATTETPF